MVEAVDSIAEIIFNDDPDVLTADDALEILSEGAVTVTCTNTETGHGSKTYGLISGSITVESYEYTTSGYVSTITVDPDKYVAKFVEDKENVAHGTATPDSQTITLTYTDDREWVESNAPVAFTVTCTVKETDNITLTKTVTGAENGVAHVDDTLTYTITLTNSGTTEAVVTVEDSMWTDLNGSIAGVTGGTVDSSDVSDGEVVVTIPGNGGTISFYYTYTIPESDVGKTLTNNVTATTNGENPEVDETKTETTVEEEEEPTPDTNNVWLRIFKNGEEEPSIRTKIGKYEVGTLLAGIQETIDLSKYYTEPKDAAKVDYEWVELDGSTVQLNKFNYIDLKISEWYAVNYHIVGAVQPEETDWSELVLNGSECKLDNVPGLTGYTFNGWYEKVADIDAGKLEARPVNQSPSPRNMSCMAATKLLRLARRPPTKAPSPKSWVRTRLFW